MQRTNRWNRFIYCLWAPISNATINHIFLPGRRRALELLAVRPGERLLLVGVGTGTDLLLLPGGIQVLGIDLGQAMLARASRKLKNCRPVVQRVLAGASTPLVAEGVFNAAAQNFPASIQQSIFTPGG